MTRPARAGPEAPAGGAPAGQQAAAPRIAARPGIALAARCDAAGAVLHVQPELRPDADGRGTGQSSRRLRAWELGRPPDRAASGRGQLGVRGRAAAARARHRLAATVKVALAASVPWSLAVWWLGEGLGGLLAPGASFVTGAPGAVILYAVLAAASSPALAPTRTPARCLCCSRPRTGRRHPAPVRHGPGQPGARRSRRCLAGPGRQRARLACQKAEPDENSLVAAGRPGRVHAGDRRVLRDQAGRGAALAPVHRARCGRRARADGRGDGGDAGAQAGSAADRHLGGGVRRGVRMVRREGTDRPAAAGTPEPGRPARPASAPASGRHRPSRGSPAVLLLHALHAAGDLGGRNVDRLGPCHDARTIRHERGGSGGDRAGHLHADRARTGGGDGWLGGAEYRPAGRSRSCSFRAAAAGRARDPGRLASTSRAGGISGAAGHARTRGLRSARLRCPGRSCVRGWPRPARSRWASPWSTC